MEGEINSTRNPVELVQAWGAPLDPQFFLNIDQKWTTISNEQIV